jgi:hypothetical protein
MARKQSRGDSEETEINVHDTVIMVDYVIPHLSKSQNAQLQK